MPVTPDGTYEYTYSGYRSALYSEWKHEDAEERAKKESRYHGLRKYYGPHGDYTWSAVLYPPPGKRGRVEHHFVVSTLRSPLMIMHRLPGEMEAALAKDLLDLWYGQSRGWSEAKLAAHDWNFPQMKLWEESELLRKLGRYGPEEYSKAQRRVRSLVSMWLPHVPKDVVEGGKEAEAAREKADQNILRKCDRTKRKAAAKEVEEMPKPGTKSKAVEGTGAEGGPRKRARVPQGPAMNAQLVERAEASHARVERAARRQARAERNARRVARSGK